MWSQIHRSAAESDSGQWKALIRCLLWSAPHLLWQNVLLLADNGLITLAETEDLYNLTSIAENPHNFEITELDAANLPRSLDDVDAAVINGNYALEANLNPEKDALAAELADSDESYKYINYLVVKEGNEESTKTKALIAALQNDDVKKYIEEKYSGSVIPAF